MEQTRTLPQAKLNRFQFTERCRTEAKPGETANDRLSRRERVQHTCAILEERSGLCLLHSENSIHSKAAAHGPVMVSTRHLSHQDRSKSAPGKKTDSLSEGGENKTAVKKKKKAYENFAV